MGSVLIAFLAICISCAAVLAAASFLYRFLVALPKPQRAAAIERPARAASRAVLSACASHLRVWVRARRLARPHHGYAATATTRH